MNYGIYDDRLGWITQDGKVVTSTDPERLREVFLFGDVRQVHETHDTVDLNRAFRPGSNHITLHRTTREGVDGRTIPMPVCRDCMDLVLNEVVETSTI